MSDPCPCTQAEYEALIDAIRVYTSRYHKCSTRPCSCGAFSTLADLVWTEPTSSQEKP